MKPLLFLIVLVANGACPPTFVFTSQAASGQSGEQANGSAEAKQSDPFLLENNRLRLKNPPGLIVTLRLKDKQKQFRQGEVIQLELTFSSSIDQTFILDNASSDTSGRLEIDAFVLDHEDGTADPLDDYFNSGLFGFMGGGLRGTLELSDKPEVVTADLNEWVRFDKLGRYRLYVVSRRVGKRRNPADRYVIDNFDVVSNPVEFEIVPAGEKWASQELNKAIAALEKPEAEQRSACRILRFLGTTAAVREMVKRFRGNDQHCDFEYDFGLISSPHRDFVIQTMERALSSPEHPVTQSFVRTLALLTFKTQTPAISPYPKGDDEQLKRWQAELDQHQRAYERLILSYLRQLITAVPHKQEKARAISLQTLLDYQASFKTNEGVELQNLLATMPEVFGKLPLDAQIRLLTYQWKPIASPAMLGILRDIYKYSDKKTDAYQQRELRSIALHRLYELSPEEGRKLILDEIRRPNPCVNGKVLRLLPEETLPELDEVLAANLEQSRQPNGSGDAEAISDLIQRYATGGILSRVQAAYEAQGVGRWACRIQASLLAYLLRVDSAIGGELLTSALAARGKEFSRCYASALADVAQLHMTAEVEEAALTALGENDPEMLSQAASVLGQLGSANAEERLWQQLERWHEGMQSRASELSKQNPGVPAFGSSALSGEALIEQALRNALGQGQAWLLDPEKLRRLRALCLTDSGRNEVDMMISSWNQRIHIGLSPFEDHPYSIRVAQYQLNSMESLKQKLRQFPSGTTFTWARSNSDFNDVRDHELFRQIEIYLQEIGMKLERETQQ